MEKYSQFRDKGTAIAPFLPVSTPPSSALWIPVHFICFLLRLPLVTPTSIFFFSVLEWIPVSAPGGRVIKKCMLWVILALTGVWWVDLQVDGVKRGHLAKARNHLPQEGTIIASSFTSPLDPLYLACIFCPIFTRSYPRTRKVQPISLFRAILLAFSNPKMAPPNPHSLLTLSELKARYPRSIICVFPECTTTNGRGILPFSPSLLTADANTKIYPVNLRYTPGDVTTPVPGSYVTWIWKLFSRPTHFMRVRIARCMYNNPSLDVPPSTRSSAQASGQDVGYDLNTVDSPQLRARNANDHMGESSVGGQDGGYDGVTEDEQDVLDRVGEDLARLGRVKRVGLGVQEKIEFVKIWTTRRR